MHTFLSAVRQRTTSLTTWIRTHLLTSSMIALVALGGGYWGYGKVFPTNTPLQYVIGAVVRGDIVTTVTGTGQVSAHNQVDLKPQGSTQSSATIRQVNVKQGDQVQSGQLIAVIDNRTALIQLHQAQANLENSQSNYDKIKNGSTVQSIAVSQSSVDTNIVNLKNAKQSLINKINSSYNDALSAVLTNTNPLFTNPASVFLQYVVPASNSAPPSQSSNSGLVNSITNERRTINTRLPQWNTDIGSTDPAGDITPLVQSSKENLNYILGYLNDILSDLSTYETNSTVASSYISAINSARSTVINDSAGILSAEQAVSNAQSSLSQSNASLNQTTSPARPEDLASAQAQLNNYKAALESAQYNYDQSFLRAPFDGVVAQVDVSAGDQANTNTVVATIITNKQLAEISLNEVDAAQVRLGATTTLTVDALPTVTIHGSVSQIDTIGTVTQGVVSYKAKIAFDAQNKDVRPGMSISATIETKTEKNQLLVPNSALRTIGSASSVQLPQKPTTLRVGDTITLLTAPSSVSVQIGDSDNNNTVITSGLTEGQIIIARKISGATPKPTRGLFSPPQ
jgi:HlyD family secretion protein